MTRNIKLLLTALFLGVLCLSAYLYSASINPVNPASKETQIKQLEEEMKSYFADGYRKDLVKMKGHYDDQVSLKPFHFFSVDEFQVMPMIGEEYVFSADELIAKYKEVLIDRPDGLTDEEIQARYDGVNVEVTLYDEAASVKKTAYYTPRAFNSVAASKAKKKKPAELRFKVKKGDAIISLSRKDGKQEGASFYQYRYFSDGWKIVAESMNN